LQLSIEKLIYGGDGLARLPADEHGKGKTVFLPFVLPGERVEASIVEARPGFARARVDTAITPSADRVEPGCGYFERCGGCHYQHIEYSAQLRYKAEILRETLRRTGKFELQQEIKLHSSDPWAYRNRTRMHVRQHEEFALGYFRYGSHVLLPVESCPISSPLINRAIAAVWTLGRQKGIVPEALHGLQFFSNHDDSRLLVELYLLRKEALNSEASSGSKNPPRSRAAETFAEKLRNLVPELAGVAAFATAAWEPEWELRAPLTATRAENPQTVGDDSLVYHAAGLDYRVSGGSFFQTNRHLIDQLVEATVGKRTGRAALDLYAGAGLFTSHLARNFDQVIAVEASPHSFADLRYNVPHSVKCLSIKTEAFLAERAAKLTPDLIVLDPPRAGMGQKSALALARMSASHVTYVSCDPATLSRDLVVLLESGYRVEQVHLVDLFPQTYHMETVVHLAR
jgi:23S rRNA (uracil1939-C5)-methyltransferase